MHTRNGLSARLLGALAIRPAGPGLVLVAGLLAVAISGWPAPSVPWFWPAAATFVVLAVVLNTAQQELRRRAQARRHRQRMDTANALLNDRPAVVEAEPEIAASIRELGGRVESFGHKLDDLLAEVHAETAGAVHRGRGAAGQEKA